MSGPPPSAPEGGRLPQRVLLTADAVGGVWDYSLELAAGLGAAGVQVVLAVSGPPPDPSQQGAARRLPALELVVLGGRLEWMEDPWAEVDQVGRQLLRLAAARTVDLVHLGGFAHGALPFPCPRLAVAHSCVLSWWRAVKGERAPAVWNEYRRRVRAGLLAADLVVAPSAAMLGQLLDEHGPLPRTAVIHNGRSVPAPPVVSEKQRFVLAVGRLWDEAKNVRALCALAPQLPWPVKVAGALQSQDGGAQARTALPTEGVQWLGRLPGAALAAHYRAAAIYALPARYEPFGLSVLEAALHGCALVLGDLPSLRELWDQAALFVPPDDQAGLRGALLDLMSDDARRQRLGLAARRRALRYGHGPMVQSYLALYRRLLQPGCPAQPPPQPPPSEAACAS